MNMLKLKELTLYCLSAILFFMIYIQNVSNSPGAAAEFDT